MTKAAAPGSWRGLLERLGRSEKKKRGREEELALREVYDRFREILDLNDSLHRLIVEVEDQAAGRRPFLLEAVVQKLRQGLLDLMMMVKDLNQISDHRHRELYNVIMELSSRIDRECVDEACATGPLVVGLAELSAGHVAQAGGKMANLAEAGNAVGLDVPDGFVVTTSAFRRFMDNNGLWERAHQLRRLLVSGGRDFGRACREVQTAILAAPLPPELDASLRHNYELIFAREPVLVAVRSSAVGEDLASTHAGQYHTELNVGREGLAEAYRLVAASAYRPHAVAYREERGLAELEAAMAVGCLRMIAPRLAGVMFTRDFRAPESDRIELAVTRGLADRLVQGEEGGAHLVLSRDELEIGAMGLTPAELMRLFAAGRRLESHFGRAQDVEWAIDDEGRLIILQTRAMVELKPPARMKPPPLGALILAEGGRLACPGAGAGPVAIIRELHDLDDFPAGAVAVARFASPAFSRILGRAAAVVTEVGSPIGHLAILAREFGVPAIVGLPGASRALAPGEVVTVDADTMRVYSGRHAIEPALREGPLAPAEPAAAAALRRIALLVTPLHLIDPASPDFAPAGCRSFHDVIRFVHEKLYEEMFQFGYRASTRLKNTYKLQAELPLELFLFDLGGGVAEYAGRGGLIRPEDVASPLLTAMIAGMRDPRIDWRKPRPLSAQGFLSVVGQSLTAPPPTELANLSFAVVSDLYLNFGIKAGYHFSTIDAFAGPNPNQNYINFRFAGGGARDDRRFRRVAFLAEVLAAMNFAIRSHGDLLIARLERLEPNELCDRLTDLGRLTLCSRQLDMLMDSDASPAAYARAFLSEQFDRF